MDVKQEPVDINMDPFCTLGEEDQVLVQPEYVDFLNHTIKEELPTELEDTEIESVVNSVMIKPEVFICNICSQFLPSDTALNKHECKRNKFLYCQHCDFTTEDKEMLQTHVLFIHIIKTCAKLNCKICKKLMSKSFLLKKKVVGKNRQNNPACTFNFVDDVDIITGVEENTLEFQERVKDEVSNESSNIKICKINQCHVGSKLVEENLSENQYNLSEQKRWGNSSSAEKNSCKLQENKLMCKICNIEFKAYNTLKIHIEFVHSIKNDLGNKDSNDVAVPAKAELKNLKNNNNVCKFCNKIFTRKFNLNRHLIFQHKENKNETKSQVESLNSIRIPVKTKSTEQSKLDHTKNKLTCRFCNKSFAKRGRLNYHVYIYHRLMCKICNIEFKAYNTLKTHIEFVHSIKDDIGNKDSNDESIAVPAKAKLKNLKNNNNICKFCNKIFTRKFNLNRHLIFQHKENKNEIKSEVESLNSIRIPVKTKSTDLPKLDHTKNKLTCHFCNKSFPKRGRLNYHLYTYHRTCLSPDTLKYVKYFTCDFCNTSMGSKYDLQKHIKRMHIFVKTNLKITKIKPQCQYCFKEFTRNNDVKRHINNKHKNGKKYVNDRIINAHLYIFKCNLCTSIFKTGASLNKHTKKVHVEKKSLDETDLSKYMIPDISNKFKCKFCNLVLVNKITCKCHIQKIHLIKNNIKLNENITPKMESKIIKIANKKEYKCDICNKLFNKKIYLRKHILNWHISNGWIIGKQFVCEICNKFYSHISYLFNHKSVAHPKEHLKRFYCKQCPFKSKFENTLYKHNIDVHLGAIKIFKCKICNQDFVKEKLLFNHMKCKHPTVYKIEYKCNECNKILASSTSLNLHKTRCHGDKSQVFLCPICLYSFTKKRELNNHMKNHESAFRCQLCGALFKYKSLLQAHMETHIQF